MKAFETGFNADFESPPKTTRIADKGGGIPARAREHKHTHQHVRDQRQEVRQRLPAARLGHSEHVPAAEHRGQSLRLDGRGALEAALLQVAQQSRVEAALAEALHGRRAGCASARGSDVQRRPPAPGGNTRRHGDLRYVFFIPVSFPVCAWFPRFPVPLGNLVVREGSEVRGRPVEIPLELRIRDVVVVDGGERTAEGMGRIRGGGGGVSGRLRRGLGCETTA